MATVIIPQPVVDWSAVVLSNEPLRAASRSRYRTLLSHGLVSKGLTMPVRDKGKLAGKRTFHSVLAALAIRASQSGDAPGARYLGDQASRLESVYAERLRAFFLTHEAQELSTADFYTELVRDTHTALTTWGQLSTLAFAYGHIADESEQTATVDGTTGDGTRVELHLPRALTTNQGLDRGDPVLVFSRLVGHAAVVDVLPALDVDLMTSGEIHVIYETKINELDKQDEQEAAERYASSIGAPPTDADLDRYLCAAKRLPVHRIKVLG